jgi:hypothetical protein
MYNLFVRKKMFLGSILWSLFSAIFTRVRQIMAFFLETQCCDHRFLWLWSVFACLNCRIRVENANFLFHFFGGNIFKYHNMDPRSKLCLRFLAFPSKTRPQWLTGGPHTLLPCMRPHMSINFRSSSTSTLWSTLLTSWEIWGQFFRGG